MFLLQRETICSVFGIIYVLKQNLLYSNRLIVCIIE